MTKNELDGFQAILRAKVAELKHLTRHRAEIAVERSADQLEEIQAASESALKVCNIDREFNQLRDAGSWRTWQKSTNAGRGSPPYPGWQLWDLSAVRSRHPSQAAGRFAVGPILYTVPGSCRPPS
jgi:hypothetical protein